MEPQTEKETRAQERDRRLGRPSRMDEVRRRIGERPDPMREGQQLLSQPFVDAVGVDMLETPQGQGLGVMSTRLQEGEVIPAPENRDLPFAQRFGRDIYERSQNVQELGEITGRGEQSPYEMALQVGGIEGFGLAADLIGEGLTSGYRKLPEEKQEALKTKVAEGMFLFGLTPEGRAAQYALNQGEEAWNQFAEQNPRAARNVQSVVNVASLYAPPSRAAGPVDEALTSVGRGAIEAAENQVLRRRTSHAEDLVSPRRDTQGGAELRAERTEDYGFFGQRYKPSDEEKAIAELIEKAPGFSDGRSITHNRNAVRSENWAEAERLKKILDQDGNIISAAQMRSAAERGGAEARNTNLAVGDINPTVDRLMEEAIRLIDEAPQTSSGLLQVRKDFDTWLLKQKENILGDEASENAVSLTAKAIRSQMNDLLQEVNPSIGVRESLEKQTKYYTALEAMLPKAAQEQSHTFLRLLANVRQVLPIRNEMIQHLALLSGTGGLGASSTFAPLVGQALLGTGAAYGVYQFATSAGLKRAIGDLLNLGGHAIRQSTNPVMIRELQKSMSVLQDSLEGDQLQEQENGTLR